MHFSRIMPICGIVFSLFIFSDSTAAAQNVPLNIAIVDFQKVMGLATAPKGVREQVKAIRDKYRTEVQKEDADLQTAKQALDERKAILSPDAFKSEIRTFEQKLRAVQQKVQQKKQNLQQGQNEALVKVNKALKDVILKISAEKGYTLVLRRANTVVVADKLDISDEVIKRLNAQLPSVKINK